MAPLDLFLVVTPPLSLVTLGLKGSVIYVTLWYSNAIGLNDYVCIGTHDVDNFILREDLNGTIEVETGFFGCSTASGALFSFVFITDSGDVDFTRSVLLSLDRNTSHNYTLPFNLYPGHYRVHVYDIEHKGALASGVSYPAVVKNITLNGNHGNDDPPSNTNSDVCRFNTLSREIKADCSFPNNTDFQIIAQSSNSNEVHKLYVNQSTDLQTPVTVQVERAGKYQVSAFSIGDETPSSFESALVIVVTTTPVTDLITAEFITTLLSDQVEERTLKSYNIIVLIVITILAILVILGMVVLCFYVYSTRKTLKIINKHQSVEETWQDSDPSGSTPERRDNDVNMQHVMKTREVSSTKMSRLGHSHTQDDKDCADIFTSEGRQHHCTLMKPAKVFRGYNLVVGCVKNPRNEQS